MKKHITYIVEAAMVCTICGLAVTVCVQNKMIQNLRNQSENESMVVTEVNDIDNAVAGVRVYDGQIQIQSGGVWQNAGDAEELKNQDPVVLGQIAMADIIAQNQQKRAEAIATGASEETGEAVTDTTTGETVGNDEIFVSGSERTIGMIAAERKTNTTGSKNSNTGNKNTKNSNTGKTSVPTTPTETPVAANTSTTSTGTDVVANTGASSPAAGTSAPTASDSSTSSSTPSGNTGGSSQPAQPSGDSSGGGSGTQPSTPTPTPTPDPTPTPTPEPEPSQPSTPSTGDGEDIEWSGDHF